METLMTDVQQPEVFIYDNSVDDVEEPTGKNRARVGSVRPTALLYTSGIGATVDLPHMSVIVQGLDFWEPYYKKLNHVDLVIEKRLLEAVQSQLGPSVQELRQPPWMQADVDKNEAQRIGVPATLFPRWLRCTGCNKLATPNWSEFVYRNTNSYRPDQAAYFHKGCRGRGSNRATASERATVPARFLLACTNGHIDEFPYVEWVHKASGESWHCTPGVVNPLLEMVESQSNTGPQIRVTCLQCKKSRTIQEATGEEGEVKLPYCRGRHPHLGTFENCQEKTKLMLLGSANQWFPSTIGLLVMPTLSKKSQSDVDAVVASLPQSVRDMVDSPNQIALVQVLLTNQYGIDLDGVTAEMLWQAFESAKGSVKPADVQTQFDPLDLLSPEWEVMQDSTLFKLISEKSDFKLVSRGTPAGLAPIVEEVVAVERLKKVNAFIGFTRVDPEDRIGDELERRVDIWRAQAPTWVPATEDRGEGVFLQFNEDAVQKWETAISTSQRWEALRASHERNFKRRMSKSAVAVDPDSRLAPPRYWAIHSLSHILIREMAVHSGYGAASLTERIYAWQKSEDRSAAAGLLISTTSADSEGTLGGLVELSDLNTISELMKQALAKTERCSSDPLCATRLPVDPEEYLHGSACHFCLFVSETSCEKSNRFLDRAMLRTLKGTGVEGLFAAVDVV